MGSRIKLTETYPSRREIMVWPPPDQCTNPFARSGFHFFARNAGPLVQSIQSPPRLLPAHNFQRADHTASSWLDLAESRLRLDRLAATAAPNFLPLGVPPIPREARKFFSRRSPLRCGSQASASSIAFGTTIAIEAAVVAGSKTAR